MGRDSKLKLRFPSALRGWFRSPLEAGLVVALAYGCGAQDHSWASSAALCVLLVQHVALEGVRWQLALLYMAVVMQACGMRQTAAIAVMVADVLITLGLCFLFPFIFPLQHQGVFKVGSVDLHLRPYEALALPEDTWGLRVRIFYPTASKPLNLTSVQSLPRCSITNALLLAAANQFLSDNTSLIGESPIALGFLLGAGVCFDIAHLFAAKMPYLAEGLVTAKGFARYAGMPLLLFSHMTAFRIDAVEAAQLLQPTPSFDGCPALWPVLVFSHGLGGGRTAYSTLVTDLASKGIVVVCPEHADGSGAVTVLPGKTIPHEEITVPRYEAAEHVIRQRQLNRRVRELHWIVRALSDLNGGDTTHFDANSAAALASFHDRLALDMLSLCGHSFGGATALHLMMDDQNGMLPEGSTTTGVGGDRAGKAKSLADVFQSIICLDPWMYPLSEHVLQSARLKVPALIMHAEKWQWEINLEREMRVASRAEAGLIHLRLKDAGHHNYADFGLVAPRVSRYMKLIGNRDPSETMMVINHVVGSYIQTNFEAHSLGVKATEALVPFQHILSQQFVRYFDFLSPNA